MNFKSSNRRFKQIAEIKKNLPEIDARIKELEDIYDQKWENIPLGLDFKQFQDHFEPEVTECSDLKRKRRLVCDYKMEAIPEYCDVMSMEDFVANVHGGGFIDSDGSGNYARGNEMTNITIRPSDIKKEMYRSDFDKVVWFNK